MKQQIIIKELRLEINHLEKEKKEKNLKKKAHSATLLKKL